MRLSENSQVFLVKEFNICFYMDSYKGNGNEYYLLVLEKFDSADKFVAHKSVYVKQLNDDTYRNVWHKLHDIDILRAIFKKPENSIIKETQMKGVYYG